VTAGGSGMGRAGAAKLASEGASVVVADIDAAEGIRVNAVCPGLMDTAMLPRFFTRIPNPDIESKIPVQPTT
jgi:NAD(P)-dependent dehydrogenase (short-subunit alcohol dehydrogenase family)